MDVAQLATALGVSERDADDFVIGVSMQVAKGLDLEAAIRAHAQAMRDMFQAAAARLERASFSDPAKAFVVDAFFPAQVAA
ncbi:hypothetical protein FHR55_000684 [Xanthomonas arboricola]